MRLRHKIGAAMAAVTLTGLLTTGVFTALRVSRLFRAESDKRLMEATTSLAAEWRAMADRANVSVGDAAQSAGVRSAIQDLAQGSSGAHGRAQAIVRRALDERELDFLEILDDQGVILANAHWPVFWGRVDQAGLEIVQGVGRGPAAHWRIVKGERLLAVEAARRLEADGRTFHLVGGRAVTLARLNELGLRVGSALDLQLYLQMNDGTRLLPPGVALQDVSHLKKARAYSVKDVTFVAGGASTGEPASISLLPVQQPNGQPLGDFVMRVSHAGLNALSNELQWAFLSVGAVGIVVAFIVGFFMARRITRPIEELARAAARVGVGRSPGRMPEPTEDEVGDLIRTFRRMTEDLAESRRELVRAERIATWREIAQKLAHEIKNALSPIQISVENIQRSHAAGRPEFNEILTEAVHTVRDEVAGLRRLVNEFSHFARMPELKLVPADLNAVVQRAALLHEKNDRGIRVTRRLAPELPTVALDAEALARAVGNLVLNAVEASPAGAEVAVTTALRDDEHVEVIIDDLGPGVPPEVRERVFEPYFTTKEGGTGLGLAMVYKVVAEHGGRIEIEDRPGGGGRFRIMLPTAEAVRDAADRVAAEAQAQADRMPPAAGGEAGGPGPATEGSPSTAGGERERRVNG